MRFESIGRTADVGLFRPTWPGIRGMIFHGYGGGFESGVCAR